MTRHVRAFLTAVVAIAAMAAATSDSLGAGVRFGASSTIGTANPITLRDSSLGNVLGGITLTFTLSSSITCPAVGTALVQKGGISSGRITITSPAGYTAAISSFPVYEHCINGVVEATGGLPVLYALGVRFSISAGLLGTYTYSGNAVAIVSASPASRLTGQSSSFTSDRGTTASFVSPWSIGLSPTVPWSFI